MSWKETSFNIIVVSGFLAVVVAIAVIPSISSIENGVTPRSKVNAQNIASVYNAAIQAGADFGDRNDLRSIAELLREGVNGSGAFASATFWVRISPEEFEAAEEHLIYDKENRAMLLRTELVRRKAQRIALVANSAIAAGIDFGDSNDVRSIAELLREGVDGSGAFEHAKFIVDITPGDLDLAETMLFYDKENRVTSFK